MTSLHPFDALMELDTADIRLDCAALHLSRDAYPYLDVGRYLARLDELAECTASRRPGLTAPQRYQALRETLCDELEFRGNEADYYDPRNSYLNCVLERRLGIPISLSVVWIEVGRRLKWSVAGVALPGHFLVRIDDAERFVVADPFRDGRALSLEDCHKLVHEQFDGKVKFASEMLQPVDTRAILTRMLNNLRAIYLSGNDWPRLDQVLLRLAAVDPRDCEHLHELAAIRYQLGDLRGAYHHLAACLQRRPSGADNHKILEKLAQIQADLASRN